MSDNLTVIKDDVARTQVLALDKRLSSHEGGCERRYSDLNERIALIASGQIKLQDNMNKGFKEQAATNSDNRQVLYSKMTDLTTSVNKDRVARWNMVATHAILIAISLLTLILTGVIKIS